MNAEYDLGDFYDHGKGVPQSYAKAVYWYRKAAKQREAIAEYRLGNSYYHGQGVPQNSMKAIYWWKKAAAQGVTQAQRNLQIAETGSAG